MGVRFACHACGKRLNVKSELAGRRGICPTCSVRFRIPAHNTQTSTPVDASDAPGSDDSPATTRSSASASKLSAASSRRDVVASPTSSLNEILGGTAATWYVRPTSGGQFGPADGPTLNQWIIEGRVADSAMLWRDGWPEWRTARGFLPSLKDTDQQRTEPAASAAAKPKNGNNGATYTPKDGATENAGAASKTGPASKIGVVRNTGPVDIAGVLATDAAASSAASHTNDADAPLRTGGKVLDTNKKKLSRKRVTISVVLGLVFVLMLGLLVFVLLQK